MRVCHRANNVPDFQIAGSANPVRKFNLKVRRIDDPPIIDEDTPETSDGAPYSGAAYTTVIAVLWPTGATDPAIIDLAVNGKCLETGEDC